MAPTRRIFTVLAMLAVTACASLLNATAASAHVTASSPNATQGGFATITIKVPTESATASTTKLSVALPADTPIAFISVQPHPGWSFTLKKTKLDPPVPTEDGELTEAVTQITWTADSTATGIKPTEFDMFNISAGPLPAVEQLFFPAIQTYSDGEVVKWIERQAPGSTTEPEFPAPTLRLASTTAETASTTTHDHPSVTTAAADNPARGRASTSTATTGIVLGALGVALGAAALFVSLRRSRQAG